MQAPVRKTNIGAGTLEAQRAGNQTTQRDLRYVPSHYPTPAQTQDIRISNVSSDPKLDDYSLAR